MLNYIKCFSKFSIHICSILLELIELNISDGYHLHLSICNINDGVHFVLIIKKRLFILFLAVRKFYLNKIIYKAMLNYILMLYWISHFRRFENRYYFINEEPTDGVFLVNSIDITTNEFILLLHESINIMNCYPLIFWVIRSHLSSNYVARLG